MGEKVNNKNGAQKVELEPLYDLNGAPMPRSGFALRAVPAWLTVDKESGKGDDTVAVTAAAWQGRNGRNGVITVAVTGSELTETVTCNQEGTTIYQPDQTTMSFVKAGATKAFTGKANLASISFATSASWITLGQMTVTLNDEEVGKFDTGEAITGDPGSSAVYDFSIDVTAAANPLNESRSAKITINGIEYNVTQEAADATLTVTPTTLTFIAAGESKSFNIQSNGSWTIS